MVKKFVDRKDKYLIDNFTESNNDQRTKVSSDLDFLYSLTSKYIDDETGLNWVRNNQTFNTTTIVH